MVTLQHGDGGKICPRQAVQLKAGAARCNFAHILIVYFNGNGILRHHADHAGKLGRVDNERPALDHLRFNHLMYALFHIVRAENAAALFGCLKIDSFNRRQRVPVGNGAERRQNRADQGRFIKNNLRHFFILSFPLSAFVRKVGGIFHVYLRLYNKSFKSPS